MGTPSFLRMTMTVGDWIVNAVYEKKHRQSRPRASFMMVNAVSNTLLKYPEQSDEMECVLDREYWPQFILELVNSNGNNPLQERLIP